MALHEVSHSAVELVVGVADRCEVSLAEVCEGLPVTERQLRRKGGGLEWDHFAEMVARLEHRVGYTRMEASCAHLPDIAPNSRRLLSSFASARLLVRFVCRLMGPSMYPMMETGYDEVEERNGYLTAHVTMQLREGFRDCPTFFKLSAPSLAAVTCVIGLPALAIRTELGLRGAQYWLSVPPSETLLAKWKRRTTPGWDEAIEELEEEKVRLREAHDQLWRRRDTDFRVKLDEAAKRWGLTPRQVQVLSGLARGLSNKELAKDLGCSTKTVETHVTEVLRRANQDSRLSLVATFWREL